ncbi:MAG: hypothetical protein JNL10_20675 [Verrucomicrobiales bacterium]|nr:hypothetical protein [Verrucomicrobiales bacterium]
MKSPNAALLACLMALGVGVRGFGAAPELPISVPVYARSVSGQFVVHGRGATLPAPAPQLRRVGTNPTIHLRPDLLAVTAERVKRGVEHDLGASDAWRGLIHLQLRSITEVPGPMAIQARPFREGWQFNVMVPEDITWDRLVRGLTEVVLLERANRANTSEECTLVPLWLTTGLNRLLLGEFGRDLVTESGTLINRSERRQDPLRDVRDVLARREPMTFSELGLVLPSELEDPARFAWFEASAALLTHELIREDSGRAALADFVRMLPQSLNWQITFLRAYSGRFSSLLDIEKWWAVASAETLATDPRQHWSRDRVLARLAEVYSETADIRPETNQPAIRQTVPLRELIVDWDFDAQRDVVQRKVSQLRALRLRAPADLAPLVGDSTQVLEDYLAVRGRNGAATPTKASPEVRGRMVALAAARKLTVLEGRLDVERRNPPPAPPAPADPAQVVAPPGRPSFKASPASGE